MASLRQIIKQSSVRLRTRLLLVVLVLLAVLAIVCAYPGQLADAVTLATTRLPEGYSQLYFANQTQLPTQVKPGVAASFNFDLINLQGSTQNYQYVVTQGASVIAQGSITLQDGASLEHTVSFKLPKAKTTTQITVRLVGRDQQINFRSRS